MVDEKGRGTPLSKKTKEEIEKARKEGSKFKPLGKGWFGKIWK